ncbi:MAG TPA: TIGR03619 family F420-dependent LLM class oxidoreductase [Methylomirabilota bacterium]|nr:TIGR03619 family F420-dependent LLM class oxidoreductase [Methylomirabilota bacterium]
MRLGYTLPSVGRLAGPESIVRVAQRAEQVGYHSLWVADRLLYPVAPRTPYPASADGALPEYFKRAMDPVETLTFAAAHTRRITLGTSVLNMPFYHPVVLARRLATLDVLSGGRLRVGLGQAWSADELEAVGADPKARASRADEFIRVLRALWGPDPVEFQGRHFRVARSMVGLKPVQQPHPPLYLAGYVAPALRRAATAADGWLPSTLPIAALAQMVPQLHAFAREAGRDPARLAVVYMAGAEITSAPLDEARRGVLSGSAAQVRGGVARLRDLGVSEVIAWGGGDTTDAMLAGLERFREAAG